jgi:hypothetical protein
MPIDASKPVDGVPAVKSDLRNNLAAIALGLATGTSANSGTAITVNAASFGDRAFVRIRCTSASAVTVTLASDGPVGKMLELVQYGTGIVTASAGSGASLLKPGAAVANTSAQYDAMVFEVDTNTGSNAVWRLVARS